MELTNYFFLIYMDIMIIWSYVDKFIVFYYADNLKVSTIVSIIFFVLKMVQILGENLDGRKVGHFMITIQKSFKLIIN